MSLLREFATWAWRARVLGRRVWCLRLECLCVSVLGRGFATWVWRVRVLSGRVWCLRLQCFGSWRGLEDGRASSGPFSFRVPLPPWNSAVPNSRLRADSKHFSSQISNGTRRRPCSLTSSLRVARPRGRGQFDGRRVPRAIEIFIIYKLHTHQGALMRAGTL